MPDRDVVVVAEFLAAHAILLLGLGIAMAIAALLVVAGVVRVLGRRRDVLRAQFERAAHPLLQLPLFEHSIRRTRAFLPSGYLAIHLVLGLALTAAVAVFLVLAEEVFGGGDVAAFDIVFARALRDTATPEWERFFAAVSFLGKGEVLAVATAIVAVRLAVAQQGVLAMGWIAAQAGGGLLTIALKQTFERTRPEFADPGLVASWSFPSGHAMGTFILCGLGCYVLLRDVRSWTIAGIVIVLSLAWCVVMAFSRLYLGAHYASDVLAGVVAGAAWVAVCASAFEVVRRRPRTDVAHA